MGDLIQFPLDRVRKVEEEPEEKLSCMNCQNVYVGTKGLFCGVFKEVIVFDDIAQDCSEYESF
jgi:hypothetical protein